MPLTGTPHFLARVMLNLGCSMNELLHSKGKRPLTPEEQERLKEMARLRAEIEEVRAERVRLIQSLHC